MDRLIAANSVPMAQADTAPISGTPQGATDGNPAANIPATRWPSYQYNAIQEELIAILTVAGITPDRTNNSQIASAIKRLGQKTSILVDTGAVNAYVAANTPPLTVATWVDGTVQAVKIAHTNTGASTYAPDGLTAIPIFGLGLQPLQGGELFLGGTAVLMRATIAGVNSGNPICVLMECAGGAQQVPPATQPQHAMQLGQATGRLLNIQVFQNAGTSTYTPTPGTTAVYVRVQGGGGSGGGAPATGASQISIGSGGQAGAYAESWITSGFSGAAVTVGAGGAGIAGFGGNNGGTSSFGSFVTAPGGGAGSSAGPTAAPFVTGVSGSSIATGGNVLNSTGAPGIPTVAISTSVGITGPGASSVFGGGGGSTSVGSAGQSAGSFGAGGGGCMQTPSGAALAGGNAKPGIVIVYEYGSR
ncbi:hypothetical protein KTE58_23980 [Burkholderia multivorans]|uniref:glycine-rich domain-containing protein n=1 Tax=Burkholderia multivorans TaxID=87883 RepID=UPI001C2717C8|nr:hypothetical protein [Burkholderia multivorans]MBU9539449.1 hypothetical protein [Burkholderia multivorans]